MGANIYIYVSKYTNMRHFSAQRRQVKLKISKMSHFQVNLCYVLTHLNLSSIKNFKM